MKRIVRVEYTESVTEENEETVSKDQVRILSELDSIDPMHIQQILEKERQPTPGVTATRAFLVVTNITELQPTGDDDQM